MNRFMVAVLFVLLSAAGSWGYEVAEVKDGGTIKGKVRVTGAVPKDEVVKITKDADHCGTSLPREKYVIGTDGGVQWAVVSLEGIQKGKAIPKADVLIDNKKCAFHPHVLTAAVGQSMVVKNDDPMLHNTHMYIDRKTIFNAALPRTGMEIKKPIKKPGLVEIHCDEHAFMQGFMQVFDHPYSITTDAHGNFMIGDIPPGTYKIRLWHEAFGVMEKSVTVASRATIEVNFDIKK